MPRYVPGMRCFLLALVACGDPAPPPAPIATAPADAPRAVDAVPARPDAATRDLEAELEANTEALGRLTSGADVKSPPPRPGLDLAAQARDAAAAGPRIDTPEGERHGAGPSDSLRQRDLAPRAQVTIAARALDTTSLTAEQVRAKVEAAYVAGVRHCYVERLRQEAAARGSLALAFEVGATGRTGKPSARGFDATVARCVATHTADWRFAIPRDPAGSATTARFEVTVELAPP